MSPTNAMAGALPVESVRYVSREWDFSLERPTDWKVDFENQADPPYMLPVGLLGPQGLRGYPALTVQANLVTDSGLSLEGYMDKAEGEVRGYFPGFQIIRRWQEPLLESPTAWMSYTYMGNSGARQELNVTAFIGKGRLLWLQFIAETDRENAPKDMPILEAMVRSLSPGPTGIRVPNLFLTGVPACGLCGTRFPPGANPNAVFSLTQGMMAICDGCRKPL